LGVFLGAVSSLLYGVGDFLGGEGAKRVSAATVVLWAGVVSLPLITVAAWMVGGEAEVSDIWWGAAAGASGALGLVTLFAGLGKGQAAAVAPAAAVLSGVFPLLVAVTGGESLSALDWVGVSVAVPAIVLCSWVADPGEVPLGGVWYGLVAGIGFGGYTIFINFTSEGSGLIPLVPARTATMLVVAALAGVRVWSVSSWRDSPRRIILGNGLLDVSGNVALLLALRAGTLARVSIAASLYPAVTVLMARLVNSEHLAARQVAGLGLTLLALAAIAAG
jgi:drug/metabolite transporter (DMT)-like permease